MQTKQDSCESCDRTPECLTFKTKLSFILWAEFNLIFLVIAAKGELDLSALFSIVTVITLLAIKLRQFADRTKLEKERYRTTI